MLLDEFGLVVKRVNLTHRPAEADMNGRLGLGRKVWAGITRLTGDFLGMKDAVTQKEARRGCGAEAVGHPGEEVTAMGRGDWKHGKPPEYQQSTLVTRLCLVTHCQRGS